MLTPPSNVKLLLTLYFLCVSFWRHFEKYLIKFKTTPLHPHILTTISSFIHMFALSTYQKLTTQSTKTFFIMKTSKFFKGIALGVMFTVGVSAFAGEGEGKTASPAVSIFPYLDTNYSVLSLNNSSEKSAVLTIEGTDGEVFHREVISKAGFTQKVLDFSYLADGSYSVNLKAKGTEYFSKPFIVKNHKVVSDSDQAASASNANTSFARVVKNTLIVSYIPFEVKSVDVTISSNTEEIFSKTFTADKTFSKKFDISALPRGKYQVSINSEDKNYSYAFSK